MAVTPVAAEGHVQVAPKLRLASDLFDTRMAELGHATEEDRAKAVGLSRMGLYRLRRGPVRITIDRARHIASVLGVPTDDLFPAATAKAA